MFLTRSIFNNVPPRYNVQTTRTKSVQHVTVLSTTKQTASFIKKILTIPHLSHRSEQEKTRSLIPETLLTPGTFRSSTPSKTSRLRDTLGWRWQYSTNCRDFGPEPTYLLCFPFLENTFRGLGFSLKSLSVVYVGTPRGPTNTSSLSVAARTRGLFGTSIIYLSNYCWSSSKAFRRETSLRSIWLRPGTHWGSNPHPHKNLHSLIFIVKMRRNHIIKLK